MTAYQKDNKYIKVYFDNILNDELQRKGWTEVSDSKAREDAYIADPEYSQIDAYLHFHSNREYQEIIKEEYLGDSSGGTGGGG